jgi:beta-lactamase class D
MTAVRHPWVALGLTLWLGAVAFGADAVETRQGSACFLLHEIGVGEILRAPADACRTRVAPASTFKVPHALAALDAGVIDGPDAHIAYDGRELSVPSWRRDHTLRTAMRDSVVWYFQALAERLGEAREREYLQKFNYGNKDSSSGLTTFWLGGSLLISPEEQVRFLQDLYAGALPVEKRQVDTVRAILVQPRGQVTNASGAHPFGEWAPDTIVSAKTGSATDRSGIEVRWLVGHVARGRRAWIFASLVTGAPGVPPLAAVDQAATALTRARVLAP